MIVDCLAGEISRWKGVQISVWPTGYGVVNIWRDRAPNRSVVQSVAHLLPLLFIV